MISGRNYDELSRLCRVLLGGADARRGLDEILAACVETLEERINAALEDEEWCRSAVRELDEVNKR